MIEVVVKAKNNLNLEKPIVKLASNEKTCYSNAIEEWFSQEEAREMCSNKIEIPLDVEGLDEELVKSKQELVKSKQELVKSKQELVKSKQEQKLAKLSLDLNKWLFLILDWVKNNSIDKKEVLIKLKELTKILEEYGKIWVVWSEKERKNLLKWISTLKLIYQKEKDIINLLNKLELLIKKSKLNIKVVSR